MQRHDTHADCDYDHNDTPFNIFLDNVPDFDGSMLNSHNDTIAGNKNIVNVTLCQKYTSNKDFNLNKINSNNTDIIMSPTPTKEIMNANGLNTDKINRSNNLMISPFHFTSHNNITKHISTAMLQVKIQNFRQRIR